MLTSPTALLYTLAALVSQQMAPQEVSEETWPEITQLALQHGLGPMLLWTVKRAGLEINPEPHWSALIQIARYTAVRYVMLDSAQRQISTALAEANILSIWLKGAALARTVYPQPPLRPMTDLDVLVLDHQREAALHVVEALHYHLLSPNESHQLLDHNQVLADKMLELLHHDMLVGGPANSVFLELHWRFFTELPAQQINWFWDQTQPLDNVENVKILKPVAHLLYLCAHAVLQHGEGQLGLRHYLDLHLLITHSEIDWDLLVNQAVAFRWTFGVERALLRTKEFFSTPVPAWVPEFLHEYRPSEENPSETMSLQTKGSRWILLENKLSLLSRREKIQLIFKVVFPSKSYMSNRYRIKNNRLVWPYYFYRWFDQGQEVLWAMLNQLKRRLKISKRGCF